MKSVKTKIIALVLCFVIVSALAIGGASIINSQRVVLADSSNIMNLLCTNKANEINGLLTKIEQSVEILNLYVIHQADSSERFQTDPAYVQEYADDLVSVAVNAAQNTDGAMAVYLRFNPEFTDPQSGFFYSKNTANNSFQANTPTDLSQYDPDDTSHVGWFYEAAQKKGGTWVSPYLNKNIDVKMISYVVPFYINNVFIGVVGMDIDFNMLQEAVAETSIYKTGYAFLTDQNAKVVYHKELEENTDLMQYNHGEFEELAALIQDTANSTDQLLYYSFQGESKKATFRSLNNQMRLVLTAPTKEIDEQANQLILQIAIVTLIIIGASIFLTFVFTKRLAKPLLELNEAAQKIAAGDLSVSVTHESDDEVGTLAESFRQTVAHLHRYISYINELAYRDSLTGVKNKTAYLEMIPKMDQDMQIKRPRFGIVVFDINGLKRVNDTYGHDFGDMLIIQTSRMVCNCFKSSPVYRIGGDEFVILLEYSDFDRYSQLLEELEEAILQHNANSKKELQVSIARGIALYSEETDFSFNDVFKRADSAMYRNKAQMKHPETEE